MGRNSIPKLYEWRDGKLYRFRTPSRETLKSNSGELISYECETILGGTEILATAWADGLSELLSAMFHAGYAKGQQKGRSEAQANIRIALGLKI